MSDIRTAVVEIVTEARALPPVAQLELAKQWKKRSSTLNKDADYFDKQAKFSSRDLAIGMVPIYKLAAEVLHGLATNDPEILSQYPEI